jgi:hypothetical protein
MDHGQFHLVSAFPAPDDVSAADQEDADTIVDRTIDEGNEIAQGIYGLCVLCPHQNNFEMSLTVERWATEPPGRGFVARGWPGSTTPGDQWRIQLWPGTAGAPPRQVKRWEPA